MRAPPYGEGLKNLENDRVDRDDNDSDGDDHGRGDGHGHAEMKGATSDEAENKEKKNGEQRSSLPYLCRSWFCFVKRFFFGVVGLGYAGWVFVDGK